ncbi:hypothetical protein JI664_22245 [Rhodobacter sp. NTK016B]|uniref:hypothetical protein n=1 Tax=Rhodobacter sp. NTK016B TaxID=2759676 RepID=UPI001A8F3958|nr:hypothetical protein [Rhodobacter sp. NTK016B]MBN8294708.1 hypothetical protein [Rhodobacter sp. NTK016B]
MARQRVDRAAPGREVIWSTIRAQAGRAFAVSEIALAAKANDKTVRDYCKGLEAAGYLSRLPDEEGVPVRWTLTRDVGHEAPRVRPDGTAVRQGSTTEQLWRGMYMLKDFTFRDLIETASIQISEDTARAYCKMLLSTGYLRVLQKADPVKGRIARYRLLRNNGPKPPQIQRVKQVFDPNTREIFVPGGRK